MNDLDRKARTMDLVKVVLVHSYMDGLNFDVGRTNQKGKGKKGKGNSTGAAFSLLPFSLCLFTWRRPAAPTGPGPGGD
jgi:hypothetical protein